MRHFSVLEEQVENWAVFRLVSRVAIAWRGVILRWSCGMWKLPIIVLVVVVTVANVWMNWRLWRQHSAPVQSMVAPPELAAVPAVGKIRVIGQNGIFRPDRKVIAARLPWAELESEDYHVYARNLRAIGCPENTVRDILVADIGHAFAEELKSVHAALPDSFWMSADEREELERRRVRRAWELRLRMWSLLRDLFQYPVDAEVLATARDDGLVGGVANLVFGYLERDQYIRGLGTIRYYGVQLEAIAAVTEGILLESDYARARQIRDQLEESLNSVLGTAHLEEGLLRYVAAEGDALPSAAHGFQVSGTELRNIIQIRLAARNILSELVVEAGFLDLKPDTVPAETIDTAIAKYLGADRYADFSRARDERFHGIYTFATANGLTKKEAAAVFEARVRAEDELKSIRLARGISIEENILLQAAVKTRLEGTVKSVFGPVIAKEYLGDGASSWIGELITVPVENKEVAP